MAPGTRMSAFGPGSIPDTQPKGTGKPKILALCGAKSNNAVTQLQLDNLHITHKDYDIHFLHGNIEEEEGDGNLAGLVHGPFYSWIDATDEKTMNESIVNAVRLVVKVSQIHGPFDGKCIYRFVPPSEPCSWPCIGF